MCGVQERTLILLVRVRKIEDSDSKGGDKNYIEEKCRQRDAIPTEY